MCNTCNNSCGCDNDAPRKNTPDEMVEVVTAYRDGKMLQTRSVNANQDKWMDRVGIPSLLNFNQYQYRVKREPRTLFARQLHESNITDVAFDEAAIDHILQHYPSVKAKKLKFIEVLD